MGKITHGKTKSKLYRVWDSIKGRCYCKTNIAYKNYGGRGIGMQEDWRTDFLKFEAYITGLDLYDIDNLGVKGLTLDRVNNNGDYCEGNLRWATRTIQARNTRMQKRNKSGYVGVSYYKNRNKNNFVANIRINYKLIYLGARCTAKEAYQLRIDYIKKHNLKGFKN